MLVSMGESLQGGQSFVKEITRPTAQELRQQLHDPVVRVEITGPAFMPIQWDNAEYGINLAGNAVSLVGERASDYAVRVRFFVLEGDEAEAKITRDSGDQLVTSLQPTDPVNLFGSAGEMLSAPEVAIFHQAVQRQSFQCPHCPKQHSWNTFRCEGSSFLGEPIYSSLRLPSGGGFVLLQIKGDGVQFHPHACSVLRLGSGMVAIGEGASARLYQFDEQTATWLKQEATMQPYHEVAEGVYAIVL